MYVDAKDDYKILIIKNEHTFVVIELKKDVNLDILTIDEKHLAQLIQEVHLVYRKAHIILQSGYEVYNQIKLSHVTFDGAIVSTLCILLGVFSSNDSCGKASSDMSGWYVHHYGLKV